MSGKKAKMLRKMLKSELGLSHTSATEYKKYRMQEKAVKEGKEVYMQMPHLVVAVNAERVLYQAYKEHIKNPHKKIEIRKVMTNADEQKLIGQLIEDKKNEHNTIETTNNTDEVISTVESRELQSQT